jgi:PadR family transcriptional regulator PadR
VAALSIASDLIRGHTEAIILAHLISCDSYGYEINKSIKKKSGNRFELKEATLYTAFRRMEEAGQICSYWGDESTGARRKYYSITDLGRKTFQLRLSEWEETREIIDKLLRTGDKSSGGDKSHGDNGK